MLANDQNAVGRDSRCEQARGRRLACCGWLSIKELEAKFFEWLAAGGRKRASPVGPSRIESYDFLNAPSSRWPLRRGICAVKLPIGGHTRVDFS